MKRIAALLSMLMLATAAQAESPEVQRLFKRESALDGACRGGGNEAACCERTKVGVQLNKLGWCYGKEGQIGADMKWHHCTRTSQRHNLSDYCN
jgi:hypothetical protein